jgi:hypothetical protein
VSSLNQVLEMYAHLRADFIYSEIVAGIVYANIALSASDLGIRLVNIEKAKAAHAAVLRFIHRVDLGNVESIAANFESLNRKLIALGEMGQEVAGRRLDDRIRKLSTVAEDFPNNSPKRRMIIDRIKAEISEYFEREKNPPYDVDRRSRLIDHRF